MRVFSAFGTLRAASLTDVLKETKREIRVSAFTKDAELVTAELRGCLAEVVGSFPVPIESQSDLQRVTKLGNAVSWSLYKAATSGKALAAGRYIPKREAMMRFLKIAGELGVPERKLEATRARFDEFERFVSQEAGDWDCFEMMVTDLVGDRAETLELKERRSAFRSNRRLWGFQVSCVYSSSIVAPSPNRAGKGDMVSIGGCLGMRQLRTRTEVLSRNRWRITHAGDHAGHTASEPLFPGAVEPAEAGLIPQLCSDPLPRVRLRDTQRGYRELQILSHDLGASADSHYGVGRLYRGGHELPAPGTPLTNVVSLNSPTRVLLRDLVIHESVIEGCSVHLKAYASHPTTDILDLDDTMLFPDQPEIVRVGSGLTAMTSTDCPKLGDVVSLAMERMGWNPNEFHVYRYRIEFPVLGSVIRTFVTKTT